MKARFAYILAICLLLPGATLASAETQAALSFLQKRHDAVNQVLRKPDNAARQKRLSFLLDQLLDYEELAKRSLDREWNARKDAELKEFVSLLRQLVERQYQKNLETTLSYKVKYVSAQPLEQGAMVKTTAKSTKKLRDPMLEIDYNMLPSGADWRVYDIITDGVSLVKNYRRQFRRIIRDEGWDGLIDRMQKKLETDDDEF